MKYTSCVISFKISIEKEGRKKINFYKHILNSVSSLDMSVTELHKEFLFNINLSIKFSLDMSVIKTILINEILLCNFNA